MKWDFFNHNSCARQGSIVMLFHHIFLTPAFRIAVWIVGTLFVVWWFGAFFAQALLCTPVEKNWNPIIRSKVSAKSDCAHGWSGSISAFDSLINRKVWVEVPLAATWKLSAKQRIKVRVIKKSSTPSLFFFIRLEITRRTIATTDRVAKTITTASTSVSWFPSRFLLLDWEAIAQSWLAIYETDP